MQVLTLQVSDGSPYMPEKLTNVRCRATLSDRSSNLLEHQLVVTTLEKLNSQLGVTCIADGPRGHGKPRKRHRPYLLLSQRELLQGERAAPSV